MNDGKDREARLAEQLRANLRRRKARARAVAAGDGDAPAGPDGAADDGRG